MDVFRRWWTILLVTTAADADPASIVRFRDIKETKRGRLGSGKDPIQWISVLTRRIQPRSDIYSI